MRTRQHLSQLAGTGRRFQWVGPQLPARGTKRKKSMKFNTGGQFAVTVAFFRGRVFVLPHPSRGAFCAKSALEMYKKLRGLRDKAFPGARKPRLWEDNEKSLTSKEIIREKSQLFSRIETPTQSPDCRGCLNLSRCSVAEIGRCSREMFCFSDIKFFLAPAGPKNFSKTRKQC